MCGQVLKTSPKPLLNATQPNKMETSLSRFVVSCQWQHHDIKVSVDSKGIKSSSRQTGGQADRQQIGQQQQQQKAKAKSQATPTPQKTNKRKEKREGGEGRRRIVLCHITSMVSLLSFAFSGFILYGMFTKTMCVQPLSLAPSLSLTSSILPLRRLFYVLCSSFFFSFFICGLTHLERGGKLKKGPIRTQSRQSRQTGKDKKIYLSRALMASSESSRSWGSCLFVSGAGLAPPGTRGAEAVAVIHATIAGRYVTERSVER